MYKVLAKLFLRGKVDAQERQKQSMQRQITDHSAKISDSWVLGPRGDINSQPREAQGEPQKR